MLEDAATLGSLFNDDSVKGSGTGINPEKHPRAPVMCHPTSATENLAQCRHWATDPASAYSGCLIGLFLTLFDARCAESVPNERARCSEGRSFLKSSDRFFDPQWERRGRASRWIAVNGLMETGRAGRQRTTIHPFPSLYPYTGLYRKRTSAGISRREDSRQRS
jgi:hypothetical protein